MPKPNPLTQGLERRQPPAKAPESAPRPIKRATRRTNSDRVLVGGHFSPEVQTALRIIAAEERTTVQALLTEGINTVFARRHKPEIAA